MDKQIDPNVVTPPPPRPVSSEARELIRDWEFLFWPSCCLGSVAWSGVSVPAGAHSLSSRPRLRFRVLWRPWFYDALRVQSEEAIIINNGARVLPGVFLDFLR